MSYYFHKLRTVVSVLTLFLIPVLVSAQSGAPVKPSIKVTQISGISHLICRIIQWFYSLVFVLSIVLLLVAAYKYITSGGDSEKVKSAGDTIRYAVIGIVVALLAASVPTLINNLIFSSDGEVNPLTC